MKKAEAVTAEMAQSIAEMAGIHPDDLGLLLSAVARLHNKLKISRQRGGDVLRGRSVLLPIQEASDEAIQRGEERREREAVLLSRYKKLRIRPIPPPLERPEYPKPIGLTDILASVETVRNRLAELDKTEAPRPDAIRAEILLKVIQTIKRFEATRLLHRVSDRQRNIIENQQQEETKVEVRPRYEILTDAEAMRRAHNMLDGFGSQPLTNLIDEAAEVVQGDATAAAKVVSQWIGSLTPPKEE